MPIAFCLEPQAIRVFIRIEKLDRGPGALGVEIVRGGRGYAPVAEPEAAHPNIVFISNAALAGQDIADLLSRLHAQNAAVVLCVEAVEGPRVHTSDLIAQTHIDLLSVEQNAWMIAAHSDHCDVVATRTELDWAIKNIGWPFGRLPKWLWMRRIHLKVMRQRHWPFGWGRNWMPNPVL